MFEIPVENRFESSEICLKYDPKVTKMEVWGRSATKCGPETRQNPKESFKAIDLGGHVGVTLGSEFFCFCDVY